MAHYDTFRVQLAIAHPAYGHALWEPDPGEQYPPVETGDVGFTRQGRFHRLFNVLLPDDHPSHERFSVPAHHETLQPPMSTHLDRGILQPSNLCSHGVTVTAGGLEVHAAGPTVPGSVEVSFSCRRRPGAVLSLPVAARREDTLAQEHFRTWITEHIDSWFAFSQRLRLGIEMEDIVLVTGCHRTRSWSNIAFHESRADGHVSFGVQVPGVLGTSVNWQVLHQDTRGAVLSHGPSGDNLPENQCIFIRGYRVKRTFKRFSRVRGAAEPTPDPSRDDDEPETEVVSIPGCIKYQDPLHVLLKYIAGRAPHCDLVLVHDDDLERIVGDSHRTFLETPDVLMDYLERSQLEITVTSAQKPGWVIIIASVSFTGALALIQDVATDDPKSFLSRVPADATKRDQSTQVTVDVPISPSA
ncbi:hypothetical protein EDB87DRAFT_1678933 [Lactarius vividus]|nr:hypothetical protein EDB87DRAFT_1678933 [Lactarius vividus]